MTEGPYKLPKGWRWVRLGQVCAVNPRRPRIDRAPDAPTSFVPMRSVDDSTGRISRLEARPFSAVRSGYRYFREGDVLFAKITPSMENGKCAVARGLVDGFGFGSTEFHVLSPGPSVMPEWIWFFVRQELFRTEAKAAFRGAVGQQRVPQDFLANHLIPLPPIAEQRRIVARIEELMERVREAKRLRQEAREAAVRLWQATLAETFPKPGTELPEGWRWVRLGEVGRREATLLRPSDHPSKRFRYLGMEHVAAGQWAEPKPVELKGEAIKSQVVVFRPGLVLYGRLRPYLNKVVVPRCDGVASTEFVPIAPIRRFVSAEYLGAFLRTPHFVAYAAGNTTGSRQPRTRLEALWNAIVPLPPRSEQRCIVARLNTLRERIRALEAAHEETDVALKRLEQSILDKAFRGEL